MGSENISFNTIPDSLRRPQVTIEYDLTQAVNTLPQNVQELCLIGQQLAAFIDPARFQGGTLNDMTSQGTYTGTAVTNFIVRIQAAGTPDSIEYSTDDGVSFSSPAVITGSAQVLEAGITVTFGATTGHALLDEWRFSAWNTPSQAVEDPIQVFSSNEVALKHGFGSMLHVMSIAALDANNSLRMFTVGLADNGSNKAAGTITISGTVTVAGGIVVWIGNRRVEISVAVGDLTPAIAIALQNALTDDETMPTTFNVDTATPGEIDVIAKNAGTTGNQIGLTRELITVEGITVTLSAAALSGGTTDPDVDDALDAIFAEDYEVLVTPYNTQTEIAKVRTHVDNISGADEQRPSIAAYSTNGTLAAATTLANQINSGRIMHTYCRNTRTMPIELASKMASMAAFEEDPAKPMNDLQMKGVNVPVAASRFSNIEIETLLFNGVLPIYVGPGEKMQVVRSISTYVKNSQGVPDVTLLDIQTIRTLDYVRDSTVTMFSTKYVRQKKTDAVKESIKSDVLDILLKLELLEIVENVLDNKDGILVEDDIQDVNRVDVKIPVDVVNGLHIIAGQIVLKL